MKKIAIALVALAAFVLPAKAHFVWILPTDSKDTVLVVFGEGDGPDEYVPVTKIKQTRIAAYNGKAVSLKVNTTMKRKGKINAYFVSVPKNVDFLAGKCVYGVISKGKTTFKLVYHPKMVTHPKFGEVQVYKNTNWKKGHNPEIFEIVATRSGSKIKGQVVMNHEPVPNSEVVIRVAGGDDQITTKTNKDGRFHCKAPKGKGTLLIRARLIDSKAGTYQGKKYPETRHYATLSIPSVATSKTAQKTNAPKEDPRASNLLKEARQARAVWKNFPGFTANLEVNVNGKIYKTPVTITSKGRVQTELKDEVLQRWLRRQVGSIVSHRLSNAAEYNTPCAFADDNKKHPLGRRILILNDELHSSYRIRNKQIIEVFRSTGPIRFKITVLNNYRNRDKKFLPASYVVNSWNAKTNKLVSSTAFHDTWKRIGRFDLPATMTIVNATSLKGQTVSTTAEASDTPQYLDVKTLRFTNHKLLSK